MCLKHKRYYLMIMILNICSGAAQDVPQNLEILLCAKSNVASGRSGERDCRGRWKRDREPLIDMAVSVVLYLLLLLSSLIYSSL